MAFEMSRQLVRGSRLARELRESQQRLELAANAAGAGLWSWEPSTGRAWATERTWEILNLAPASVVQLADVLRVVHPLDVDELAKAVHAAPLNAGQRPVHFRIVKPDGTLRWIAAQGTAEAASSYKPVLVRGVVRDVTQQHRAEDEANELRRKLAHAGRVTTLGQLSASLAHEISQPLSAIQQNGETAQLLLKREAVDMRELGAIVEDIVRDNRRAAEVVQRLRSWLRQGHMKVEPLSLEQLAKDVLAVLRSEASVKQVTIECAVPATLPLVRGDRVHLSQVLLNLVMNAMDARSHADDVRHRVSIQATFVPASGWCEVCVSDTGPGILPDQLDKIFEPFVTTKDDGMGMGLSISRTIIEAHGGKLWAENEARGGARFRFIVPVDAAT
jgi:C4-dicarboxylate-specific signal transduction histidine kinase